MARTGKPFGPLVLWVQDVSIGLSGLEQESHHARLKCQPTLR